MIRINLLDHPAARVPTGAPGAPTRRFDAAAAACLVVTLLALGGVAWWLRADAAAMAQALGAAQARLSAVEPDLRLASALRERLSHLTARTAAVEARRARAIAPAKVLEVLGDTLPPGMWLMALEYDEQSAVFEGRSTSVEAIPAFVEALNATRRVPWPVAMGETSRTIGSGGAVLSFTLRAGLR